MHEATGKHSVVFTALEVWLDYNFHPYLKQKNIPFIKIFKIICVIFFLWRESCHARAFITIEFNFKSKSGVSYGAV